MFLRVLVNGLIISKADSKFESSSDCTVLNRVWVSFRGRGLYRCSEFRLLLVLNERLAGIRFAVMDNAAEDGQLDKQSFDRKFISFWVGETF
jgi:hypothetical protein